MEQLKGQAMAAIGVPRLWSTDLCACCDETSSCLDVFFCLPCQMSRQCSSLDGAQDNMDCCYCCCSMLALYQGATGTIVGAVIRYRLIEKYSITMEGAIKTFFIGTICFPCSMCQTHRELTNLGNFPGGTCCVAPPQGAVQ
jgi:Cys-rich protein (TIGR01571 family)